MVAILLIIDSSIGIITFLWHYSFLAILVGPHTLSRHSASFSGFLHLSSPYHLQSSINFV